MKKNLILSLSFILLAFTACDKDDNDNDTANGIAFSQPSINLEADETPVQIKFSTPTNAAGIITIGYKDNAVNYGVDYTTNPEAVAGSIVIPFEQGATVAEFKFKKVINAIEGEVKNVVFTIENVSVNAIISGNKTTQVNFNETASLGTALAAAVGGAMQPNQVFIDLSSGKMTTAVRTSWDLGFYSGTDFRVVLNNSVKMAAKKLETTNIDEVQVSDDTMIISNGEGSLNQIDDVRGDISKTAIAEVSATDAENKVYLINMGSNPATVAPALGKEAAATGTSRGWMKIRVLRSGSDYKVQYAAIDATTHDEIVISKNAAYNFTFFSLLDKKTVSVEPQKAQWDITFTTFTNETAFGPGVFVPYFFPDVALSNLKGDAKSYQVLTTEFTYDNFTLANIDNSKFIEDQRNIGSNWRSTVGGTDANGNPVSGFAVKTDRFFVVKDPAGNVYKLKFTGGLSDAGERGFPKFQYSLLK